MAPFTIEYIPEMAQEMRISHAQPPLSIILRSGLSRWISLLSSRPGDRETGASGRLPGLGSR